MSKRIEDMKKFFESKNMPASPSPSKKESVVKKVEKKDEVVSLNMCRDRVVVNLLEEFHPKSYSYGGLRTIIDFLIEICS